MKEVFDRIVQYPNRYKLTNVSSGAELGTFDFEEVTGTVHNEGTPIDKELFDSISEDIYKASDEELIGEAIELFAEANNLTIPQYSTPELTYTVGGHELTMQSLAATEFEIYVDGTLLTTVKGE